MRGLMRGLALLVLVMLSMGRAVEAAEAGGESGKTTSTPPVAGPFDGVWHTHRVHTGCCSYVADEDFTISTDANGNTTITSGSFPARGKVTGNTYTFGYGPGQTGSFTLGEDGRTFSGSFSDLTNKHHGTISGRRGGTKTNPDAEPSPEREVAKTSNDGGVQNGPTAPTVVTFKEKYVVTFISTYHWNNGRGTATPGTIGLRGSDGTVYGPWKTTGVASQSGVPNINWEARPNVALPPGSYTVLDSDPTTWAQNAESGGRGFVTVKGHPGTKPDDSKTAPTAPACAWDAFTMDPRQFATQPGGVLPMRRNYRAGKYLIHIGPAGKNGLDVPPAEWRTFGPVEIKAGSKYAAIIKKGGTLVDLGWEGDSARLTMYSKPPEGHAAVYVRNDAADQWYAIGLQQVGATVPPPCDWESYTMDPRQFATQPGGVLPMRRNYKTGKYRVHVGPAGKEGLDIPPAAWKTFGPFDIKAGNKYAAIIKRGGDLGWEENSARLTMYSKPPEGFAVVYVRNDSADQWYAIGLEQVGATIPPPCDWESYTMDPRQFATQPGGVLPRRHNYKTGKYLVHVGPAGKQGLVMPPETWRTFGPFDIQAGNKYAAIIQKGGELVWEENSARLQMYSKPPVGGAGLPGYAVVYVRNDSADQWYALGLQAVGAPGGESGFDGVWHIHIVHTGCCASVADDDITISTDANGAITVTSPRDKSFSARGKVTGNTCTFGLEDGRFTRSFTFTLAKDGKSFTGSFSELTNKHQGTISGRR